MRIFRGEPDDAEGWEKSLDLRSIAFPSDKITVKTLREIYPDLFDIGFTGKTPTDDQPKFFYGDDPNGPQTDWVGDMLHYERCIAAAAYAQAAGLEMPTRVHDADAAKSELPELYQYYRVSSGPHETQELIRSIERQARALAKGVQR